MWQTYVDFHLPVESVIEDEVMRHAYPVGLHGVTLPIVVVSNVTCTTNHTSQSFKRQDTSYNLILLQLQAKVVLFLWFTSVLLKVVLISESCVPWRVFLVNPVQTVADFWTWSCRYYKYNAFKWSNFSVHTKLTMILIHFLMASAKTFCVFSGAVSVTIT